ncbi:MAG: MOSC domain-containing protein [Pyrinomonadaceae bacterium]|nr:MOSC domain-containing protein [Pyrinomonadaceae bacterium]
MHISEINIYPVKSLKGISVQSAEVERRGLRLDRRWLIVDADGNFLTQREMPQMATVSVGSAGGGIVVSAAGFPDLSIEPPIVGERVTATVWDSQSEAIAHDLIVNEWFSDVLGQEVRLLYMPDDAGRPVSERFNKGGDIVSFADGYPLLAIGAASLDELNSRLSEPLPMNRFRPNIVVSGSAAFAEDDWAEFRVGEAVFRSTKPCARCVITTVDQSKGEFDGKEPLRTLASFRMAKDVIPDRFAAFGMNETAVLFGQNLIPESTGTEIRVGDPVEVIKYY